MTISPAQQRVQSLLALNLLESGSTPIFDEATQIAAHFLDVPICVLGVLDQDYEWIKAAVGLSRLGLMNALASSRQIPYALSLGRFIVETNQPLIIPDTTLDPQASNSLLVTNYRIRSYLGVPLVSTNGCCIGTLAVMDLAARSFNARDLELLELTARWSMSEFERCHLVTQGHYATRRPIYTHPQPLTALESSDPMTCSSQATDSGDLSTIADTINLIKIDLLTQMAQELRTPLTSVMGMTSVLVREIYGPLTDKQKEYLRIVHQSGQYLLSLVNEMLELTELDHNHATLKLVLVDIEMLCQQVINMLEQAAHQQEVTLRLTLEPGNRIYWLDKVKVRHLLYYLMLDVVKTAAAGSEVRLHCSRRSNRLQMTVWVHHPWLGDGFSAPELYASDALQQWHTHSQFLDTTSPELDEAESTVITSAPISSPQPKSGQLSSQHSNVTSITNSRLQLSKQLAITHGGDISIQGTVEGGYRYVLSLPYFQDSLS
ncbi:MAG: GAF domain-containing sensor histidine kinase [Cyanobacteriota bacterium SKYGB_h_bin112]|nr:GAF domain-containing sensor histidine kinase [Cyanobacteriota bacterium SKYGB_h_bin112]